MRNGTANTSLKIRLSIFICNHCYFFNLNITVNLTSIELLFEPIEVPEQTTPLTVNYRAILVQLRDFDAPAFKPTNSTHQTIV